MKARCKVMLWLCAAAVEAEYLKYKDREQPLKLRIDDLLSRMTLEEKIGQMTQIEREVASPDIMKKYLPDRQQDAHDFMSCKDLVMAQKQLSVERAPNILTIVLKRYEGGPHGKLNQRVTFPEKLDLRRYMSDSKREVRNYEYKLYAVIIHIDSERATSYGHYICYVKDFSGNWYKVDDDKVLRVDLPEVLEQNAYMLLYSRTRARMDVEIVSRGASRPPDRTYARMDVESASREASLLPDRTYARMDVESVSREASRPPIPPFKPKANRSSLSPTKLGIKPLSDPPRKVLGSANSAFKKWSGEGGYRRTLEPLHRPGLIDKRNDESLSRNKVDRSRRFFLRNPEMAILAEEVLRTVVDKDPVLAKMSGRRNHEKLFVSGN